MLKGFALSPTPDNAPIPQAWLELLEGQGRDVPLAGAFYRCPDVLQLEMERLFRRFWLFAAHECEVKDAGGYVTRNVGGKPLAAAESFVESTWYVDADARECTDYDPERVVAMWSLTGEQDWELAEYCHRGVESQSFCENGMRLLDAELGVM